MRLFTHKPTHTHTFAQWLTANGTHLRYQPWYSLWPRWLSVAVYGHIHLNKANENLCWYREEQKWTTTLWGLLLNSTALNQIPTSACFNKRNNKWQPQGGASRRRLFDTRSVLHINIHIEMFLGWKYNKFVRFILLVLLMSVQRGGNPSTSCWNISNLVCQHILTFTSLQAHQ